MDLGSALLGLGFMALCILPFLWMHFSGANNQKKALQSLKTLAAEHHCNITKHESCGDFSIGLDADNQAVFFIKNTVEGAHKKHIDLKQTQVCASQIITKPVKGSKGVISKVELNFLPKSKQPETTLELYNEDLNDMLNGEPLLAENWCKLMNQSIQSGH